MSVNPPTPAPSDQSPPAQHRLRGALYPALLILLCAAAFFWRLGDNGLFDLDEGLYAAAARGMSLRGDYVTPYVNNTPFFEKPPLIYWEANLAFRLFGVDEFAVRLPSALATAALVALLFWFGSRCFGRRSGLIAAAMFTLSPLVLGEARQLTTDATLDLWVAVALFCFYRGYIADTPRGKRIYLGFWIACSLGVLAKGAPGLLIPAIVALFFVLFAERFQWAGLRRVLKESHLPMGIVLFLVIALPWHIAAYQENGASFWHEYVIHQHLQRFQGGDTSHHPPLWLGIWYYFPSLLIGFFPWSVFVPSALLDRVNKTPPRQGDDLASLTRLTRLLLKVWIVTVFAMFSLSGSKLPSYILPLYPAAALLTGDWCARALHRRKVHRALLVGATVAFGGALALYGIALFHTPILRQIEAWTHRPIPMNQITPALIAWILDQLGVTAAATGVFWLLLLFRRRRAAFDALFGGMTLFVVVAIAEGLPAINAAFLAPLQSLAVEAGHRAEASRSPLALYIPSQRRPSIFLYLPAVLLKPHPDGTTPVFETKEESSLTSFLAQNRPAFVLTDAPRVESLSADPTAHLIEQRASWRLFSVDSSRDSAHASP